MFCKNPYLRIYPPIKYRIISHHVERPFPKTKTSPQNDFTNGEAIEVKIIIVISANLSLFFDSLFIPSFRNGIKRNKRAYDVKYQYCFEIIGKNEEMIVALFILSGKNNLNITVMKTV